MKLAKIDFLEHVKTYREDWVKFNNLLADKADAKRMNVHVEALNIKLAECERVQNSTLDLIESMASNIAALEKEIFDRAISINKKNADQDKVITELNVANSHHNKRFTALEDQFKIHCNRNFWSRLFNR